jgi:hypothetical protein
MYRLDRAQWYLGSLAANVNTIAAPDTPVVNHFSLSVDDPYRFHRAFTHAGKANPAPVFDGEYKLAVI